MDVVAKMIKLKPDSSDKIVKWQSELNRLRDEVIQSIMNEGVQVESWFQTEINGEPYLLAYSRAADFQKAGQVAAKSELEVDKIHRQFKVDTWEREGSIDFQLLVDIEATSPTE